jgi:hypothetical protein
MMLTAENANPFQYPARDLQRCAEREVAWRRRVYAGRVGTGRMTPNMARHEIAMMQAIAEHFAELAKRERLL